MLSPAFVSVAAEPSHIKAALFIMPVNPIVPIDTVDIRASVEFLPEIALGHALTVRFMQELTVVAFVAKGAQPMETDFSLEFSLLFRRHFPDELIVADSFVFVDFL
jgi:hypothetical protein